MNYQYQEILEHAPRQLSKKAAGHLDSLFEQIEREGRKRTIKRCLHLLRSYLGEGGRDAFLATSQPELEYKTGTELLNEDPEALLSLIESRLEGGNY